MSDYIWDVGQAIVNNDGLVDVVWYNKGQAGHSVTGETVFRVYDVKVQNVEVWLCLKINVFHRITVH